MVGQGEQSCLDRVLALAETALEGGDEDTRGLVWEGFLEDMQNAAMRSEGRVELADIRSRLGPRSQSAWDQVITSWDDLATMQDYPTGRTEAVRRMQALRPRPRDIR